MLTTRAKNIGNSKNTINAYIKNKSDASVRIPYIKTGITPNIISDMYNLKINVPNFDINNSIGDIGKGNTNSKSLEK